MIELDGVTAIADLTRLQAQKRPDSIALWFEQKTTTFAELDGFSSQVANSLIAAGVKPGDRVAYLGKNSDTYYQILFGAAKARAALAAINNRLAAPEIEFIASDANVNVLFVTAEFYEIAAIIAEAIPAISTIIAIEGEHDTWASFADFIGGQPATDPMLVHDKNDDVIQLYTSGTTGLPKGVQLTNHNYLSLLSQADMEWSAYAAGDSVMNAMPLFHVAGVNVGILTVAQGARAVIIRDIDPSLILKMVQEQNLVHAFWVPAVILMMTQHPDAKTTDFSSLKNVSYGASPIAESLLIEAQALMGCNFTQLYGLTETSGGGTYLPPEAHNPAWGKLRSCGVAFPGTIIRCVDDAGNSVPTGEVGEIVIKSDFVMKGYWRRPEATAEAIKDDFFYTGDAGYLDEDGFLYIHDRVKDMIISGGENIYPAEVENAVFAHPDIADAAVIGVPDEKWGEAVKAIVVLKPGTTPTSEEIINFTKERIAGYKCPKTIDYIDALPRNPSGKVLRKNLREKYWESDDRRVS